MIAKNQWIRAHKKKKNGIFMGKGRCLSDASLVWFEIVDLQGLQNLGSPVVQTLNRQIPLRCKILVVEP